MKFLVDECLHASLVTVAHDAGHVCDQCELPWSWRIQRLQLMPRIRAEGYTFVTNNYTDFKRLYAKEELHIMPGWRRIS